MHDREVGYNLRIQPHLSGSVNIPHNLTSVTINTYCHGSQVSSMLYTPTGTETSQGKSQYHCIKDG